MEFPMNNLPNIVCICIDALRYECISAEQERPLLEKYGMAGLVNTLAIDTIASQGYRFRQAISSAIHTPPSLASIFTGLYPPHTGIQSFFKTQLSSGIVTITELLSKAGYHCIHATEFPYIKLLGLERDVHQSFSADDEGLFDYIKKQDQPVYLFLHFFDVHDPYLCSPAMGFHYNKEYREIFTTLTQKLNISVKDEPFPFIRTFQSLIKTLFDNGDLPAILSLYIKGVNKFDRERFTDFITKLKTTGLFDNCLQFLFSDHGEGPGKENFGHGNELYDGMIRTPLIISYPGFIPEGKTSDVQVRLIDIMPTIIDVLQRLGVKLSLPYPIDGKSLLPIIEEHEKEHRQAYSEVWFHTLSPVEMKDFLDHCLEERQLLSPHYNTYLHQRSLRCPPWKIILEGSEVAKMDLSLSNSDDEFIQTLFISLFNRKPTSPEINKLKNMITSKNIARTSLRGELISQREFSMNNELHNISIDAAEQTNYLASHPDDEILHTYFTLKNTADQIFLTKREIPKQIIYESFDDQKIVEDRLRSLGYL